MSKSCRILLFVVLLTAVPAWGQVQLTTVGPQITSIVPTSTPAGTPSLLLTVYGKNFGTGCLITWNGISMPTTFVSSGKLYSTIPGNYLTMAGTVKIAVAARLGSTPAVPFTITSANQSEMQADTIFGLAPSLPNGTVGVAYKATLVKGGKTPYGMTLMSGALPSGLAFDAPNGYLLGTPKLAATYTFGVSVRDAGGLATSKNFTVTISPAGSSGNMDSMTEPIGVLQIATTGLPTARMGAAYNATLSATGGKPPYTWRIASGSLPPGLTLNPTMGVITGTPTMLVSASFVVEVRDANLVVTSHTYSLSITSALVEKLP